MDSLWFWSDEDMTKRHAPHYVEEAGLIDTYVCSCGWKSKPYYDGAEYAYAEWKRHAHG